MSGPGSGAVTAEPAPMPGIPPAARAGAGTVLTLTVTLALGAFLILASALLLVVHPPGHGPLAFAIGQNQSAKTLLYVGTFAVLLPAGLVAGARLADAIASRAGADAAAALAVGLAGTLAAVLVLDRLLAHVHGGGLGVLLVTVLAWGAGAAWAARRAGREPGSQRLARLARHLPAVVAGATVLALVVLLCLTDVGALSPAGLVVGVLLAAGLAAARARDLRVRSRAPVAVLADVAVIVLIALAVPNVVVFHPSPVAPNSFAEPGIIQFHQDFLLGPANQLLGGGALLVNVPVSQYGVAFIDFLAGWFHLVPIGYGSYGLLDGLVTALFYMAGWAVLRLAGVGRGLAAATLAFAVATLIYHFYYAIGELPQQGALRFGLPMLVVLGAALETQGGRRELAGRAAIFLALAAAAVWAIESLVYTGFVYLAVTAASVWLARGARRPRLIRALGFGVAAVVGGQLAFAAATLIATGQLPDWGEYLYYVRALVLGGTSAGQISYGFANWSPGLAVGAAAFASCAALVVLARRGGGVATSRPVALVALAGFSAYAVALFSYTDNRSSTYLLPYVALPLVLCAALWLTLALAHGAAPTRRLALTGTAAVAVLMLGAAWPTIGSRFSLSALAHAYPGGGLGGALRRLAHPPAVDPRAPAGQRLLDRYAPARSALVLLPDWPDLGTEILIRSHRRNVLTIGDPKADAFIDAAAWTGTLGHEIDGLPAGGRMLADPAALRVAAALRGRADDTAIAHPVEQLNPQLEWILHRLDQRFVLTPIDRDPSGLMVVSLVSR